MEECYFIKLYKWYQIEENHWKRMLLTSHFNSFMTEVPIT